MSAANFGFYYGQVVCAGWTPCWRLSGFRLNWQ